MWFRDPHPCSGLEGRPAWAAATLVKALSLNVLPPWHPWAQDLEETLVAMAAAIMPLQGEDGFWRSDMLNSSAFPQPETSGTAGPSLAICLQLMLPGVPCPPWHLSMTQEMWFIASPRVNSLGHPPLQTAPTFAPGCGYLQQLRFTRLLHLIPPADCCRLCSVTQWAWLSTHHHHHHFTVGDDETPSPLCFYSVRGQISSNPRLIVGHWLYELMAL